MTDQANSAECSDCGTTIDMSGDTAEHRVRCPKCGGSKRILHISIEEQVIVRDGLEIKARRTGEKKPYVEDRGIPSHSQRLNKIVNHQRLIDRDRDFYRETVTDYETGEIIHHCEEPLSQHQGHGSAKTKK
jgi:DNA-directed RNA polymerase subunit RPC12/RpoP